MISCLVVCGKELIIIVGRFINFWKLYWMIIIIIIIMNFTHPSLLGTISNPFSPPSSEIIYGREKRRVRILNFSRSLIKIVALAKVFRKHVKVSFDILTGHLSSAGCFITPFFSPFNFFLTLVLFMFVNVNFMG